MSDDTHTDDTAESTDPVDDVEHHLGGIAASTTGVEVFATPEVGRLTVDVLELYGEQLGGVKLGIRSDGVAGGVLLGPDQSRALAERLARAAEDLEEHRADTDDADRPDPTRHEPADLGGGESTGVQDL